MNEYIATFHTHLSAMRTERALLGAGIQNAALAPVPRRLSASCGTCVRYAASNPCFESMDGDVEKVVQVAEAGQYIVLMENQ